MKRTVWTTINGIALTGLMITAAGAGSSEGPLNQPAVGQQEPRHVQPAQKKDSGSRREQQGRAEVQKAKVAREQVKSRETGTATKKGSLSKRNKAKIEQTRQSEMRQESIRSDVSGTPAK